MEIEKLKKDFPTFNWDVYFTTSGLKDLKEVNVCQPDAMKEVNAIIDTVPLEDQILYLQWNLINSAANYLSDDFVAQNFDFYGRTMSGKKEMQPRWKRAVSTVDSSLGEAVGQMYVEKYFPAAAKERMVALVKNLQESLGERIRELSWMGEETKEKAMEKASQKASILFLFFIFHHRSFLLVCKLLSSGLCRNFLAENISSSLVSLSAL